jgi:deoxyribose-phosphate aldolase
MPRRAKRNERDESSDDEGVSRKDWVREVHRTARTSGRVLDLPPASPQRSSAAVTAVAAPVAAPAVAPLPSSAADKKLSGMFAIAVTPSTGSVIDRTFVQDYAAALKADGVSGVICGSLAGEAPLLTIQERKDVIAAWAATGLNVVADVTAPAYTDSAALVSQARSCGVKTVAVSMPFGFSGCSAEDVASHVVETCRMTADLSCIFVYAPCATRSMVPAVEILRSVSGRCNNLAGCLYLGHDVNDLVAASQITPVIAANDNVMAAAAAAGVTAFGSMHFSTICPLATKIVAAAQKGDAAASKKLSNLASIYFGLVNSIAQGSAEREVAVTKAITAFRLECDVGHVRAPGPRLTVHEVQKLRTGMEDFVVRYKAAVGTTPAPGKSSINVHSMPGFRGQLDDKIRERALRCGDAAGVRDILRALPHLGRQWRGAMPGRDCDIAQFIDHTVLKPECTAVEISKLTAEARKHNFYAVCVNGCRVDQCMRELNDTDVRVAAVIGFPLGAMTSKAKAREAREIVQKGAEEIDMVMNVGAMKDGDLRTVYEDIKAVVDASRPAIVKVIFETCLLTADEIMDASILSVAAGAGFLKTATGFNKGGATPEAIDIMLAVAGNESLVKASGGVRTAPDALAYITAGVKRIGTSSGIAIITGAASAGGY